MEKLCPRCGTVQEIKSGYCGPCRAAYLRDYFKSHPDILKNYYRLHREKMLERARQWRQDNLDKAAAYGREYYQKNKLEILAKRKAKALKTKPQELT